MGLILGVGRGGQAVATPAVWFESLLPELTIQTSCESHLEHKDDERDQGTEAKALKEYWLFIYLFKNYCLHDESLCVCCTGTI